MTHIYAKWNTDLGRIIGEWHKHNGNVNVAPPYSAIAWLDDNGKITSSALFNDYNTYNISVHICMPGKFNLGKVRTIFRYCFDYLKCTRLTAMPKRSNSMVVKLIERLDFNHEATLNEYWGPGAQNDAMVYVFKSDQMKKWVK